MAMSKLLWKPTAERIRATQMHEFMTRVAARHGIAPEWEALRRWSIDKPEAFWPELLGYVGIEPSAPATSVMSGSGMLGTKWLTGMKLNYARHLLRFDDDRVALFHENELGQRGRMTRSELRADVARCAAALRAAGVTTGLRVGGFMPNIRRRSLRCLPPRAWGRSGRRARRISVCAACWTALGRSSRAC
jgi:acetoacetyl-CoA synthetase